MQRPIEWWTLRAPATSIIFVRFERFLFNLYFNFFILNQICNKFLFISSASRGFSPVELLGPTRWRLYPTPPSVAFFANFALGLFRGSMRLELPDSPA